MCALIWNSRLTVNGAALTIYLYSALMWTQIRLPALMTQTSFHLCSECAHHPAVGLIYRPLALRSDIKMPLMGWYTIKSKGVVNGSDSCSLLVHWKEKTWVKSTTLEDCLVSIVCIHLDILSAPGKVTIRKKIQTLECFCENESWVSARPQLPTLYHHPYMSFSICSFITFNPGLLLSTWVHMTTFSFLLNVKSLLSDFSVNRPRSCSGYKCDAELNDINMWEEI